MINFEAAAPERSLSTVHRTPCCLRFC